MAIFATSQAMITAALKELGIVSEGELATGEQSIAGLLSLNMLFDELSIDRSTINVLVEDTKTLSVGTGSYEIKTGSAVWNTAAPVKIESAFIRDTATNVDTPLTMMTQEEYNAIPDKTVSGQPTRLFYLNSRASAYVYLNRLPDAAYSLHIFSWKALSTSALTLASTINFPPGYESAFFMSLVIKIASWPAYNVPISPVLLNKSEKAWRDIGNINYKPNKTPVLVPADSGGSFGINELNSGSWRY